MSDTVDILALANAVAEGKQKLAEVDKQIADLETMTEPWVEEVLKALRPALNVERKRLADAEALLKRCTQ